MDTGMKQNFIITDENDIYVYFELIQQIKPKTILDVGMFLKRIGAVTRAARGREFSRQIELTGADFYPEYDFPVYYRIYDRIFPASMLTTSRNGDKAGAVYDLAVLFHINEYLSADEKNVLWDYLMHHCAYLIGDTTDSAFVEYVLAHGTCQAVTLEGRQYAVVTPIKHAGRES